MEQITDDIIQQAKSYFENDDYISFIDLFFGNVVEDEDGIEFETWTDGGVNMVHYLSANEGGYFFQLRDLFYNFDVDATIDQYRLDEKYKKAFTIQQSLDDFTSYEKYLKLIQDTIIL